MSGTAPTEPLESWLQDRAGIDGEKLEIAVAQCHLHLVECVADLQKVHASNALSRLFPQLLVLLAVERALDREQKNSSTNKAASKATASHAYGLRPRNCVLMLALLVGVQSCCTGGPPASTLYSTFKFLAIDPNAADVSTNQGLKISNTATQTAGSLVQITGLAGKKALEVTAGTSEFTDVTITGTCNGCGGYSQYVSAGATATFSPGNKFQKTYIYESTAIAIASVTTAMVCSVSPAQQLITGGDEKAHSMYCYVSSAGNVKVVLAIGNEDITEGNGNNKIADGFSVNILVTATS